MLRIILLVQVLLLVGCFNSTMGGLTPNQEGSGALDSKGNPIQDTGVEDSVAIIDKGIVAGEELVDDEVSSIEQKRQQIIEQKLTNYQDDSGNDLTLVVYFAFDSADINENSLLDIAKHADFLKANPDVKLRLLGHTDERGSREYNLALGENRALAVARILELYNIGDMDVISYGEERPIDARNQEDAWALNRRVEFIYY